jgi:hypothetical protein
MTSFVKPATARAGEKILGGWSWKITDVILPMSLLRL